MKHPLFSDKCLDGASQHTFEITDVVGREGNDIIVEWVCLDCDATFTERNGFYDNAYASSEMDEVDR